jgi:hypothetical protein
VVWLKTFRVLRGQPLRVSHCLHIARRQQRFAPESAGVDHREADALRVTF